MSLSEETRCGYVAIVGRPNVGKSTLLNHILGQKISITSRKPQTTRHQILGIKTDEETQIVFVDTPGMHQQGDKAINRYMNKAASSALQDVDAVVFVVDGVQWRDDDEWVLQKISLIKVPVILAINKIDRIENKDDLLPFIETVSKKLAFDHVIPLSALNGDGLKQLEQVIEDQLPVSDHFFSPDQITDRSERFLVAEIIREKIMRQLGQELPYALTVEIEDFKFEGKTAHIHALILVERAGQKPIVIGKQGTRLRKIGTDARKDIEKLIESKVMLNLWVKVKGGWSDDERALRSLGYDEH